MTITNQKFYEVPKVVLRNQHLRPDGPQPAEISPATVAPLLPQSPRKKPAPFDGAALWAEIHRRALAHDGSDDTPFIRSVSRRLPCLTCRPHWFTLLQQTPPVFGPGYFAWTVAAHNAVNQRLGKPVWTVEQAQAQWSQADLSGSP